MIEERSRLILGLTEGEDVDAVGDDCVVGRSERLVALLAVLAAESGDPCAIAGRKAPVADEGSCINTGPMWFTPDFERAERVSTLAFLTERAMARFPYTATVRKRCTQTELDMQGQNITHP